MRTSANLIAAIQDSLKLPDKTKALDNSRSIEKYMRQVAVKHNWATADSESHARTRLITLHGTLKGWRENITSSVLYNSHLSIGLKKFIIKITAHHFTRDAACKSYEDFVYEFTAIEIEGAAAKKTRNLDLLPRPGVYYWVQHDENHYWEPAKVTLHHGVVCFTYMDGNRIDVKRVYKYRKLTPPKIKKTVK